MGSLEQKKDKKFSSIELILMAFGMTLFLILMTLTLAGL